MRKLYFLVPGTDKSFFCGGLFAELKILNLAKEICHSELVTYRQREIGNLFLDDILKQDVKNIIFIISWGFDIPNLIKKLKGCNVVYHAHSSGYRFNIPSYIPIITVSRNTMGYWGQKAPHSPIYYLPNQISDEFRNLNLTRDIDVLVQKRKSSRYLLEQLVPQLQSKCRVVLISTFVEDITKLFNHSKVYLYDSAEYWAQHRVSEGFGLQPMEAIACGCQIFSSLNGGLSDYLDPEFNCQKIAVYSTGYDIQRILKTINSPTPNIINDSSQLLINYRGKKIIERLEVILNEINLFFDYKPHSPSDIKILSKEIWIEALTKKIWKKLRFYKRFKFFHPFIILPCISKLIPFSS
ncbi:MAG: glycosyltransferase [Candidatus Atelocyanobacterium thalassa isolate SIO64986]|uniref:Glycosyltransferase n=1 Tax=Candidatus Atelocyanobacterium thalassa isolate SIO64986 TaxID=1527444 RepID=A0A086CGU0_9CHRO|nr:MAG: glycosyltransferase [Candidatus Atelocyanobacterium thalassa isolate SIO64986]